MYVLSVRRDFRAEHFLIGGDWGAENQPHTHPYRLEVELQGETLDAHGYLLDIVDLEARLEAILARYADQRLNDLPEFAGLNPSLEHFARIVCQALTSGTSAPNLQRIRVRLWENDVAWASYERAVG
ncbi:MAG: 6-carboxytetrahydropterin synthase [Anaerolineales bacterium]|nr:6-carboxytetrahydropterin synthase [Anaerolineales bacterium]